MFGIDLGLGVASITLITDKSKKVVTSLVIKSNRDIKDDWVRIKSVAARIVGEVERFRDSNEDIPKSCKIVCLEEPIYSWGRRNPKVFAKSVMLFTLVRYFLQKREFSVISVNNKAAKMMTGYGNADKEQMIQAFKKKTGMYPGSSNRKGQETLADSYFIALAGLEG